MYIHNLNADWSQHPFFRTRFLVKSAAQVQKIAGLNIAEIDIDTERGLDVPEPPPPLPAPEVEQHAELPDDKPSPRKLRRIRIVPERVSLRNEMTRARKIYSEASSIVQTVLIDARLGRQVDVERIQPTITAITASVLRNPDAMISLFKVKQADKYTFQHSVAVATLLIAFCRSLEMDRETTEQVGLGGLLHDIGKMKVPHYILNKPGKLTESEFAVMQRHVEYGELALESASNISQIALDIVLQHHERLDGSGYPRGLKGDQLSIYGQMASIVDVYDAMTSDRIYHQGRQATEVLQILMEKSNRHFNPELVQHFVRGIGIYPVGSLVRLESEHLAVVIEQHREDLLHPTIRVVFSTRIDGFVPPRDIDLSKPGVSERIIGFESPIRWKIDPRRFL